MFQELVHKADLGNGYYLNPYFRRGLCGSGSVQGWRNLLSDSINRRVQAGPVYIPVW